MVDNSGALPAGARVKSPQFGFGTVEIDKGATVIVRFDHGLEECERAELVVVRSLSDAIEERGWDAPLAVITRALAAAIVSVNDAWGVFSRSRIALLPHQLWVCRRVLATWPARWLIADDVGLGKTVEAGLILWPLLSRGLVRRLLIIAPASLVEQWQYRLRSMFDIRVARYLTEADTERSDFWETHPFVVGSLETLRLDRAGRQQRLLESPPWDLVMVDEAHHLNVEERSGPTLGYALLRRLVEAKKVQSMLFFTGTPHRGKNLGFLSLLHLLRPDLFDPQQPLEMQLKNLRHAVIRNNKAAVTDLQGKRLFQAPLVQSETYAYSAEEARFYQMLTEFISTGKAYASTLEAADQRLVMLVLTTMQKLASSSVAAIRRALRKRLARVVEEKEQQNAARRRAAELEEEYAALEASGQEDDLTSLDEQIVAESLGAPLMEDEELRLRELLAAAEAVTRETKIERILELVQSRFAARSVLFFTEYKATQSLLMSELHRRFGDGCVAFINGDERAEEVGDAAGQARTVHQRREDAADQFNSGKVRFLVSTEAGGEGIDLQERCHSLVHVDLPWNPMRLHQRVGRLNRYGQTQRVEVIMLRNPATVEARIWDILNAKIDNIMAAFGQIMEEPEDLLQMVLGMTSPSLFRELFAEAPHVPAESLASWFDQKTATFGGRDVTETVKEIVGNCARFDFQKSGRHIPPVDLPDLRPFLVAMLVQNRRRPRSEADGSFSFKTPDAWRDEIGVRDHYERLVFDRGVRDREAVQRVMGVGHKAMDQALKQALGETACVAAIPSALLRDPIIVARFVDRVTRSGAPIRSAVVAAEKSPNGWVLLRDWELSRRLNRLLEASSPNRMLTTPPNDQAGIRATLQEAQAWLSTQVDKLDLGFRVPSVEVMALFWPGQPVAPVAGEVLPGEGEPHDEDD